MTPRNQELLDILQEEASEVIQAISKKNVDNIHIEIGDFCGIMKILMAEGYLNPDFIQDAAETKINKVRNKK